MAEDRFRGDRHSADGYCRFRLSALPDLLPDLAHCRCDAGLIS
ncbi:hypothetical protein [Mesorhizobium sp.]|nr:hypothetical protein [Mesorhizobium sp.]